MSESNATDAEILRLIDNKDWDAILALLDAGRIDPNRKIIMQMFAERHQMYLLPSMVQSGANSVVKRLLEKGANPNQRYEGETPLIMACEAGNHEAVELLLAAGADLEQKAAFVEGEGGETALMLAAENYDLWAVERLLKAGADAANATATKKKQTAVWFSTSTDYPNRFTVRAAIIRALVAGGCPLCGNEIHWPIFHRDLELTSLLLELGVPVNQPLSYREPDGPAKGDTPLTLAVEASFVDMASFNASRAQTKTQILKTLLSAKADPNVPNGKGYTPLLLAVMGNDFDMAMQLPGLGHSFEAAKLLVAAGADPMLSPPNCKFGSALDLAKKKNAHAFVELFTPV